MGMSGQSAVCRDTVIGHVYGEEIIEVLGACFEMLGRSLLSAKKVQTSLVITAPCWDVAGRCPYDR